MGMMMMNMMMMLLYKQTDKYRETKVVYLRLENPKHFKIPFISYHHRLVDWLDAF